MTALCFAVGLCGMPFVASVISHFLVPTDVLQAVCYGIFSAGMGLAWFILCLLVAAWVMPVKGGDS